MASSIVPTSFHPRFVGGPKLGSGINPSMLRKTQLVQFWLDQQYAGVEIRQVQGSPSYSSASGGVHGGKGNAEDFVLVDSLGRSPSVNVWVAASAMFRLLDCVSYIRGSDVNQDGRKDDSFEQHAHVLDREGPQVYAANLQISQYLAHQNGLMGGRADLEATVNNPLTLATYTDDIVWDDVTHPLCPVQGKEAAGEIYSAIIDAIPDVQLESVRASPPTTAPRSSTSRS